MSTQKLIDEFYLNRGDCCAGCDWWRWHNSRVGDCTRSAPVSAHDRVSLLGFESISINQAGHMLTPRDHVCGEFKDDTGK